MYSDKNERYDKHFVWYCKKKKKNVAPIVIYSFAPAITANSNKSYQ